MTPLRGWVECVSPRTKKTDFAGTARTGAVGFEAGGLSFIALGTNSSQRFDDVWELRAEEK